ncbi:MAG: Short-chain dehydrogenase/reductase [Bacteroidetes bacterium]|nr:Short-chain dehydrogenase/reductase [Bacteroidota bacterium]
MSISHQTIYITGGSTGIGLSLALELAKANNSLCLFARDIKKLEQAQAAVSKAGSKCNIYAVDAKDYTAVKETMDQAVRDNGSPDLLINCVGRAFPDHFENITAPMMEDTMRTNFSSVWNVVHVLAPHMKAKGGRIVNTSSIGGFIGVFGYADYSASKFAVIGFSEVLKQELAKYNITVQVLCPPDTDTPGFAEENKTKPEETKEISKSAKLMTAEALAAEAVKAMQGNKFMIIPGGDGKLTYWMKRHFPFVVNMIMDSAIAKVQKGK